MSLSKGFFNSCQWFVTVSAAIKVFSSMKFIDFWLKENVISPPWYVSRNLDHFQIQYEPTGNGFSVCHVTMANCPSYVHTLSDYQV